MIDHMVASQVADLKDDENVNDEILSKVELLFGLDFGAALLCCRYICSDIFFCVVGARWDC